MARANVTVPRALVQPIARAQGVRLVLTAAAIVALASCSPAPGPVTGEPEPAREAPAQASQAASAAPTTSAAPPPTAAASQAPRASYPVNRADKTSFACGDKRCTAGKETCCMHPAAPTQGPPTFPSDATCVEGKEAGPHVRDLTQVFELQCKYGGPGKLSIFSRCDESQDCGAQAMCCHRYTFAKESSAHRCLPFVGVGAGPCPGDELCVIGGEPCRTPGAECIVDKERGVPRCIKRPKDPDRVCETAADCLAGQRCLHPTERPAACVDRGEQPDPVPCASHAECQAYCTDKRGTCAGLGGGSKEMAYPLCNCP